MDRQELKDKYNDYYKEFKKKEWYQLSQFDKLFILLLDIADDINTNSTTSNPNKPLESKTAEIVFNNGFCSDNFTLPSTNCLLINPTLDKDITINLQIAYKDIFVETPMYIDIPKNTQLVTTNFNDYKAVINRKDSCRLCSNQVLSATFLMYYV